MNVAKSLEIKEIENNAIKKYIPGILLMESAAEKVVKIMEQECQKLHKKKIAVVCGIGNNGGDGFAVARKLYNIAKSVDIYFIEEKEKLPENARLNFEIAKNMGMVIDKKLKSRLRQNQPKVNLLSDDYDGVFWLKENVEYIS